MGLKDMFGWSSPRSNYTNEYTEANALQQSTATNLAHALQNNANYHNVYSGGGGAGYSGYQNIANSASQAQQNTLQQMALNQQRNAYQQAQAIKDEPPKVNLNEGAWSIPISQLVDLWVVRFGSKWVDHEEVAGDEFYQIASLRLEKMGKLETHHLQDRYMPVYKIVE